MIDVSKIIKEPDTVIERDMKLLALFFELFRTALGMALEQLDLELAKEYKKQGYVIECWDRRTVQCLCGIIYPPTDEKARKERHLSTG